MKLLVKKILSTEIFTTLRNSLNIKPIQINKYYSSQNLSISDAFLFRTDNNFSTLIRFSDIPSIYYGVKNSEIEILFYDNKNNFLKKIDLKKVNKINEITIDKKFLNNAEIFGHFYIFHKIPNNQKKNIHISNRCYLGFSKNGSNPSFVHGNSFVKGKNFTNGNVISNFVKTSFFKNFKYCLQENFLDFDKIELFINNPTSKKINFNLMGYGYELFPDNDIKIKISKTEKIEINSNCALLRPIVFTYKDKYYDVHHA